MAMEPRDWGDRPERCGGRRRQSLVIGPGALSHGDLEIQGDIYVGGSFRGRLKTPDTIIVQPAGSVDGTLVARRIRVDGRVAGTLRAHERIELGVGGKAEGRLQAPSVEIDPGGSFDGIWHVIEASGAFDPISSEPSGEEAEPPSPAPAANSDAATAHLRAQYDRLKNLPNYLQPLELEREPFSNSPDPEFFYICEQYRRCLGKIDLAVRLRMGFNVILGEVGTGKTTMCRLLIQQLSKYGDVDTHLFPDPHFGDPEEFLSVWLTMMGVPSPAGARPDRAELLRRVRQRLLEDVAERGKRIVLLIDEGQKIPAFVLDILCDLNEERGSEGRRLLQVIIFAQNELESTLESQERFRDQLRYRFRLQALDRKETRALIDYRLKKASGKDRPPALFSSLALREVHRLTGGYPRKIIQLCHWVLLTLVIRNRTRAGWTLVRSCARMIF